MTIINPDEPLTVKNLRVLSTQRADNDRVFVRMPNGEHRQLQSQIGVASERMVLLLKDE